MNNETVSKTLMVTYLSAEAFKTDFPGSLVEGGIFLPDYFGAVEGEKVSIDLRTPNGLSLGILPARVKEIFLSGQHKGISLIYDLSQEERRTAYERFGGRKEDITSLRFSMVPFFRYRTKEAFNATVIERQVVVVSEPKADANTTKQSGWAGIIEDIFPAVSNPLPKGVAREAITMPPPNAEVGPFDGVQDPNVGEDAQGFDISSPDISASKSAAPDAHKKAFSAQTGVAAAGDIQKKESKPQTKNPYQELDRKKLLQGLKIGGEEQEELDLERKRIRDTEPSRRRSKSLAITYFILAFIILAGILGIFLLEKKESKNNQNIYTIPTNNNIAVPQQQDQNNTDDDVLKDRPDVPPSIPPKELAKKYDEQGEALYQQGMTAVAEGFFERALKLDPNSPNALRRLSPATVQKILHGDKKEK